ncbi:hypothetical protein DXG01_001105 [Tephrocybe rancida]|nr:hypothetical protein DXG01_001105 [Tephrocybe rancida]
MFPRRRHFFKTRQDIEYTVITPGYPAQDAIILEDALWFSVANDATMLSLVYMLEDASLREMYWYRKLTRYTDFSTRIMVLLNIFATLESTYMNEEAFDDHPSNGDTGPMLKGAFYNYQIVEDIVAAIIDFFSHPLVVSPPPPGPPPGPALPPILPPAPLPGPASPAIPPPVRPAPLPAPADTLVASVPGSAVPVTPHIAPDVSPLLVPATDSAPADALVESVPGSAAVPVTPHIAPAVPPFPVPATGSAPTLDPDSTPHDPSTPLKSPNITPRVLAVPPALTLLVAEPTLSAAPIVPPLLLPVPKSFLALDVSYKLNPILQISLILQDAAFHDPNSPRNEAIKAKYPFRPSSPDYRVLMTCGPPRGKDTGLHLGFTAVDQPSRPKHTVALYRPLPYRLQPFHQGTDTLAFIDEAYIAKAVDDYRNTLFSGVDHYSDFSAFYSLTDLLSSEHLLGIGLRRAHMWSLATVRVREEICHIAFMANGAFLPSLWEDLLTTQFVFEFTPDLIMAQSFRPMVLPSTSIDNFRVEEVVPFKESDAEAIHGELPQSKDCALGNKSFPAAALFAVALAALERARKEAVATALGIIAELSETQREVIRQHVLAEEWVELIRSISIIDKKLTSDFVVFTFKAGAMLQDHAFGGLLLALIVQKVGFIGECGVLDAILAIIKLPGQLAPTLPHNFVQVMISLTVAAAILAFKKQATVSSIRNGAEDLRKVFGISDPIARELTTPVYDRADLLPDAMAALVDVEQLWMGRAVPGLGPGLEHPWTHMVVPEFAVKNILGPEHPVSYSEGAHLRSLFRYFHHKAQIPSAAGSAEALVISAEADVEQAITYLVRRHHLDRVPAPYRRALLHTQPPPPIPAHLCPGSISL